MLRPAAPTPLPKPRRWQHISKQRTALAGEARVRLSASPMNMWQRLDSKQTSRVKFSKPLGRGIAEGNTHLTTPGDAPSPKPEQPHPLRPPRPGALRTCPRAAARCCALLEGAFCCAASGLPLLQQNQAGCSGAMECVALLRLRQRPRLIATPAGGGTRRGARRPRRCGMLGSRNSWFHRLKRLNAAMAGVQRQGNESCDRPAELCKERAQLPIEQLPQNESARNCLTLCFAVTLNFLLLQRPHLQQPTAPAAAASPSGVTQGEGAGKRLRIQAVVLAWVRCSGSRPWRQRERERPGAPVREHCLRPAVHPVQSSYHSYVCKMSLLCPGRESGVGGCGHRHRSGRLTRLAWR